MDTISISQAPIISEVVTEKKEKTITKEVRAEEVSIVAILTRIESNQKWMMWAGSVVAGFLIVLIGYSFFYMDNKIDKLDAKIDKIAIEIKQEQKQEIQRLDTKIDGMRDQYIIPMKIEIEKIKTKLNIK